MKKHLFVLCFLLGLVGTHAWAQFRNTQLYYVTQPYRNNTSWAIAYNGTKLQSNVGIGVYTNANDSRQQFAVLSNDCGNTHYLYHAAEKKFVNKDGSLSNEPYDPIYFKNGAYNSTFVAYFDQSHYINIRESGDMVIDSWSTPDGGNSCVIYIVSSSFDPTEALLKFGWYIDNTGHLVVAQDYSYNNNTDYPWYAYREQITSVEIREGVGEIGAYAFSGCSNLSTITIPTSIYYIGAYAFNACNNLTEVHISSMDNWLNIDFGGYFSNPLTKARNLYLSGKLVTTLVVPDHITEIKNYAFDWCSSLTSITLHADITSIGNSAFSNCSNLTNVISFATRAPQLANDNPIKISPNAVLYYPSGSNYTSWQGKFSKALPFITSTYQLSNTQLYYVSQPFRNITSWAVDKESNVLKSNVEINMAANSSDACQQFAFISNDGGATRYMYYPAKKKFVSKDGSLTDKPTDPIYFKEGAYGNTFIAYFDEGHYINVSTYGSALPMHINNWYTPDGGNSCILVPVATFDPTEALIKMGWSFNESTGHLIIAKDYSYSNRYEYLWHEYREQITSVEIRKGVTEIGAYALYGCSNLQSITIPASINTVGGQAFRNCDNLTEVHISSMDAWLNIDFLGEMANPLTGQIINKYQGGNLYLNGNLVTTLVIPESITKIKDYAFDWCWSLTSVTLHSGVTALGKGAFSNCRSLTNFISFATTAPTIASDFSVSSNAVLYHPSGSNYTAWSKGFSKTLPFITSTYQLSNTQLYYVSQPFRNITSWAVDEENNVLKSNVEVNMAANSSDACQQFAFISNDGGATRYMYYPAKKKFASKNGSLTDKPTDPIYFKKGAYDNTFVAYFDESHYINVNSHHSLVVNNWNTPDGGNSCILVKAGSFDPTEALKAFSGSDIKDVIKDNTELTIYDLKGRKIQVQHLEELPEGIYIINGKKTVIK